MAIGEVMLGIDIGGTKCAAVLGTPGGEMVGRVPLPTDPRRPPAEIVAELVAAARGLLAAHGLPPAALRGIGVSCGGPLDHESGVILRPPNLPLWDAVPIRALLQEAFPGVQVEVENDANATALAEWRWGAGRGCRSMVFVTMGTGIGGGLILDGRLYRGASGLAGELGHQTILVNGPLCGCGKKGCLEALASGPAIARLAQDSLQYGRGRPLIQRAGGRAADITARHVVEAARDGDAFARGILAEVGGYMGIGLANVIQILNPERIVLGTIAVHAGDLLLGPIRDAVAEFAWERSASACQILPAALGDRAQDLAALSLVSLNRGGGGGALEHSG